MSYNDVEFFDAFEMAQKKFDFLDRTKIEQDLKNIERKR